jgi:hypothetical protein
VSISACRPPCGGGKRTRTADPLLAKQVLFQLSYTPGPSPACGVVGLGRVELPTSPLSGVRSSQLSYRPSWDRAPRSRRSQGSPGHPDVRSKLNRNVPVASAESIDLGSELASPEGDRAHGLLRKEVIQPQVLLQLPCYDFTPITSHSVGACLLAVSPATSRATDFRDVTGGVYKARERIHRGMLIRDY